MQHNCLHFMQSPCMGPFVIFYLLNLQSLDFMFYLKQHVTSRERCVLIRRWCVRLSFCFELVNNCQWSWLLGKVLIYFIFFWLMLIFSLLCVRLIPVGVQVLMKSLTVRCLCRGECNLWQSI